MLFRKKMLTFIVLLCGCTGGALMAQENFEVKYKIIQGKKIAQIIDIPANWNDDYYYVIGAVRNLGKKNALVSIAFWHNKNKYFTTSGFREVGWVDGNNSAARIFLFPIGMRNEELPMPADGFSYRIKILQTK